MAAALAGKGQGAQQEGLTLEGLIVSVVANRVVHATTMNAGEVGLVAHLGECEWLAVLCLQHMLEVVKVHYLTHLVYVGAPCCSTQ